MKKTIEVEKCWPPTPPKSVKFHFIFNPPLTFIDTYSIASIILLGLDVNLFCFLCTVLYTTNAIYEFMHYTLHNLILKCVPPLLSSVFRLRIVGPNTATKVASATIFPFIVNDCPMGLTLLGRGGWISPHFFQMAISPWKKGSGDPKFRDFS